MTAADPLARLADVIESRKPANGGNPDASYVARLLHRGPDSFLKKIGEEATEVVMAAKDIDHGGDRAKLVGEVADLWFHCMIALAHYGLKPADVVAGRGGNAPLQFDREIGETPGRIEHVRLGDGAGGTRIEAERARAASVERRRIRVERQVADDDGEKQPRSAFLVDQAGVLPDPPDPGVLRVNPLLHRPGIHVRATLEAVAGGLPHPGEQAIEPRLDNDVVVVAPRIA